ncbi:MAG TPA: glycosyltransferase [Clostridia bacterium]|nr:glycosyltransferase [Clostridia bacterium]
MIKNKVSVVLPIYNVENFLPECLDSVIKQTYKNLQIILVNDGSTDNSGVICDKYAEMDERIVAIHKPNGGVSSARNKGICLAQGEHITFIDPDDYIHPKMIETLVDLLIEHDADISACFTRGTKIRGYEEPDCESYRTMTVSGKEALYKLYSYDTQKLWGYNPTAVIGRLYKTQLFKNGISFDEAARRAEDLSITPYLLDSAEKIVSTNRRMYYVYNREGSLTRVEYTPDIQRNLASTLVRMYENRVKYFSEKGVEYNEILNKIYLVALFDIMETYSKMTQKGCKRELKKEFDKLYKGFKTKFKFSRKQSLIMFAFKVCPNTYRLVEKVTKLSK